MIKETVFLADSSYAIRKISERNFSEESNYSLVTFKSGQDLKEQLLEQRPQIVLVELKLPEWNGYEVCRFINSEPQLENTHVFLLRAAFDAVEEDKLLGMNYADIVTKPFDHTALIEKIEKLGKPAPMPAEDNIPEDFPEIDDFDVPSEQLSFSDIKDAIDSEPPPPLKPPEPQPLAVPRTLETFGDDVQPSEEITQGSIPTGRDPLSTPSQFDEIDNPFDDDSLQEHINEQESELGIGSITQEALAIQESISKAAMEDSLGAMPDREEEGDTSEVMKHTLESHVSDDDFKDFSFDDNDSMSFPTATETQSTEPQVDEVEDDVEDKEEMLDFNVDEKEVMDSFESRKPQSFLDIAASKEDSDDFSDEQSGLDQPEIPEEDELPHWAAPSAEQDFSEFMPKRQSDEDQEDQFETPRVIKEDEQSEFNIDSDHSDFEEQPEAPELIVPDIPQDLADDSDNADSDQEPSRFDDFPGVEDPSDEDSYNLAISPEPDNTRTSESQAVKDFTENEFRSTLQEPEPPLQATVPQASAPTIAVPLSFESMSSTDREIVLQRIEQNISQTLKDILWDIIPPIAERILREEIESIKKEIVSSID